MHVAEFAGNRGISLYCVVLTQVRNLKSSVVEIFLLSQHKKIKHIRMLFEANIEYISMPLLTDRFT